MQHDIDSSVTYQCVVDVYLRLLLLLLLLLCNVRLLSEVLLLQMLKNHLLLRVQLWLRNTKDKSPNVELRTLVCVVLFTYVHNNN